MFEGRLGLRGNIDSCGARCQEEAEETRQVRSRPDLEVNPSLTSDVAVVFGEVILEEVLDVKLGIVGLGAGPSSRAVQQMYFLAKLFNAVKVLDIPGFKGTMKKLTHDEKSFQVGQVEGSVTCIFFSVGQKTPSRTEIFQPRTSSSVGHLHSSEMHLVVQVQKCESLAIADEDKGASSPFLRVSCLELPAGWDNMMQTSFVLKNTTRPTFNHTFYFPVRFFNQKITSRKYLETAFLSLGVPLWRRWYEMKSKGDIQIQARHKGDMVAMVVWHNDDASSTSLGFTNVSLVSVLTSNQELKCTLRGRVKGVEAEDSDDDEPQAKPTSSAWDEQEKHVRWFDGFGTPLIGCQIANPNQALLYFEAYFYPPWPTDFQGLSEDALQDEDTLDWTKKKEAFIECNEAFAENFSGPFPNSIGAKKCVGTGNDVRSFPCIGGGEEDSEPRADIYSGYTEPDECVFIGPSDGISYRH
eukprot:Skav206401  [mRNA]  locus=scaffold2210:29719:46814:+ [translate_table: standard]